MSTTPDLLGQFGGQPVGSLWASPWSKVYFVDGEAGSDGNDGKTPDAAKKTIAAAVAPCTRGDVVYVRPNSYSIGHGYERYVEQVTITMTNTGYNLAGGTTYPLCQPSDIYIIGCSNSPNPEYGPRWKHPTDASTYCLVNSSPGLHLENIGFFAESAAGAVYLRNGIGGGDTERGADGTTFYNCVIKGSDIVVAEGGDGLTIERCRFHCKYNGTPAGLDFNATGGGRRLHIRNCEFQDGNGTPALDEYITLSGTLTEVVIRNCYFAQVPTGNAYIVAAAGVEGIVANCYFGATAMSTTGIEEGGLFCSGIYDVGGLHTSV